MKNLKTVSRTYFASITLAAVLAACVTVNVNFPESTVQKATDDYVKELYQAKEKGRASPSEQNRKTPPKPTIESGPGAGTGDPAKPSGPTSWIYLPDLIPIANAAEADLQFKVNTPKASAIQQRLAANVKEVLAQKKAGNLGESNDGMLVVKTDKALLVKKLEPMVKTENADREALYEEIQSANNMAKSRLVDIKKSFARSFQSQSPAGTWIQSSDGGWSQK